MNQDQAPTPRWKRYAGIASIAISLVLIIAAISVFKSPPRKNATSERAVKVRSIVIPSINVVPRLIGYGRVAPGRTWESVAQISGQVVWVSDDLRDGKVISTGTELLHIDDANYRLTLAQSESQLKASEVKYKTAKDSLAIAQKNLTLLKTEHKRNKNLAAKGTISKAALDTSNRQLLTGQTQVENLQNSLDLIDAEHETIIALRDVALLDLQRTKIITPFDARITKVNVSLAQYASKGQPMFTADGLEVAEIEAQFSVGILRPLIKGVKASGNVNIRANATQLNALVRLRTASHMVEWPARVDRVSGTIDPLTQNLGVIVAVDNPYAIATPGERPPLRRDTFVEVELTSKPISAQNVVPLSSIHNGSVYVVNKDSRLDVRKIEVDFVQQEYAVIASGVTAGERIITSDLITASPGMLLAPQEDPKTRQRMITEATGMDSEK